MHQNFFTDINLQKVLKQSNKITHSYNNKFGTFLIYPLFKHFTIIYACQPLNKKSSHFVKKLSRRHHSIYTVIETLNPIKTFKHKSFKEFIPRTTRQISLSRPLEEIHQQMHPKGRYNAKLAQKRASQSPKISARYNSINSCKTPQPETTFQSTPKTTTLNSLNTSQATNYINMQYT